ncbi:MAG: HAMP domain-containing histidine kinase [Myxococcales bacterium]|nr:HAMP domain-containing histidine kinase [Myxococcales bacterium]
MELTQALLVGPADRKPAISDLVNAGDVQRCLSPFVMGAVEGVALFADDGPAFAVASRPGGALTRWETLPPEAMAALRRGAERSFGVDEMRFDVRPLFAGADRVAVLVLARRADAGGAVEGRLADAVTGVLGQLLQAAFAAWVTSEMHLAASERSHEDLTAQNTELQRAVEHLRHIDRLKSNFLATVSHELRTPLTSVIGFSEMLLEGMAGQLSAEQREYVETILGRGEELLSLITQLLEMSSLEGGTVRLELRPWSVVELVTRALDAVSLSAERAGLVLVATPMEVPAVIADADKVQRVLVNLLGNAIKFTPQGGRVTVEVTRAPIRRPFQEETLFGEEDPDAVRVTVRDTGIGIEADELGRIFEAFYQVDAGPTRAHGGAGLGLSIVRNLVAAHGGEVWVESAAGQGTAVHFTLPIASGDVEIGD